MKFSDEEVFVDEDLWEIPLYIKSLNPEYRLYIRHHSKQYPCEMVLYAVMPE